MGARPRERRSRSANQAASSQPVVGGATLQWRNESNHRDVVADVQRHFPYVVQRENSRSSSNGTNPEIAAATGPPLASAAARFNLQNQSLPPPGRAASSTPTQMSFEDCAEYLEGTATKLSQGHLAAAGFVLDDQLSWIGMNTCLRKLQEMEPHISLLRPFQKLVDK